MRMNVTTVEHTRVSSSLLFITILTLMLPIAGCSSQEKFVPFAEVRARSAIERGDRYIVNDDLDRALREFETAIELKPNLAVAHSKMGWIWRRKGDLEAAVRAYATAIRLDPFNFDDSMTLGDIYQQIARYSEAAQAYLHACELRPQDYEARLNLGASYHQANRIAEAILVYRKAAEIDGSQPAAYTNLGVIFDSQSKLYEAIHAYNESLERNPRQPMVLVNLATTLLKQDRLVNARDALTRAIEIDPSLAVAYERVGYCCLRQRMLNDARQAYEQAVTLDPEMSAAHAGLGMVEMALHLQEPDKADLARAALSRWQRSLELDPNQPKVAALVAKYQPAVAAMSAQTQPGETTSEMLASALPEIAPAGGEPSAPHVGSTENLQAVPTAKPQAAAQLPDQTQVDADEEMDTADCGANTAMHLAASTGQTETVALLVERGASVNRRNADGQTPLHLAVAGGHRLTAVFLVTKAIVNATDNEGRTPLHLAAAGGDATLVRLLLEWGADVNPREARFERMPLHLAAAAGHADVVAVLADKALLNAPDREGDTPLKLALQADHHATADLLRRAGARE